MTIHPLVRASALVIGALLVGCTAQAPAGSPAADLSIPVPSGPAPMTLLGFTSVGATQYVVANIANQVMISADAGSTWTAAPGATTSIDTGGAPSFIGNGNVVYLDTENGVTTWGTYPVDSGAPRVKTVTDAWAVNDEWGLFGTDTTNATAVRASDDWTQSLAATTSGRRDAESYELAGAAALSFSSSSHTLTLQTQQLGSKAKPLSKAFKGDDLSYTIAGDELIVFAGTARDRQICRGPAATLTITCASLGAQEDGAPRPGTVSVAGDSILVAALTGTPQAWIVRDGTTTPVKGISEFAVLRTTGFASSGRPVLQVNDALFFVESDGTLTAIGSTVAPAVPDAWALSVGTLTTLDRRGDPASDGLSVWQRPVTDTVGDETLLTTDRAWPWSLDDPRFKSPLRPEPSDLVSAGRSVTVRRVGDGLEAVLYDGTQRETAFAFEDQEIGALSGPYLLWRSTQERQAKARFLVSDVLGRTYRLPSQPAALFGSRALFQTEMMGYEIRDVRSPDQVIATISLSAGCVASDATMWGPWVVFDEACPSTTPTPMTSSGPQFSRTAVAFNTDTGQRITNAEFAGQVTQAGDGYAVARRVSATDSMASTGIWSFASNSFEPLTSSEYSESLSSVVASDRHGRVAYLDATKERLLIHPVAGAGASAPRLLGSTAPEIWSLASPAPWRLQLDATAPLAAGTLTIIDSAAAPIVTIPTPATTTGGLHHLSWDGKNAAGQPVPVGTYRWSFTAADGQGRPVQDVSGHADVTGTLEVTA